MKIMFQVTEIVRFLLERGLPSRFRNLGFCGHDLMWTATFNAPAPIHPEGPAFFPPFLEGHGAFVCDLRAGEHAGAAKGPPPARGSLKSRPAGRRSTAPEPGTVAARRPAGLLGTGPGAAS